MPSMYGMNEEASVGCNTESTLCVNVTGFKDFQELEEFINVFFINYAPNLFLFM